VLILQIKQAETALADGRLDEAYDLLKKEEVRAHRKGQKLITRLAKALMQRAQDHMAQQRLPQALADCNKAGHLAGNLPDIARLRTMICQTLDDRQKREQQRQAAQARAQHLVDAGHLSSADQLLNQSSDYRDTHLGEELSAKRSEITALLQRIDRALTQNDLDNALNNLQSAVQKAPQHHQVLDRLAQVRDLAIQRMHEWMGLGRMDRIQILHSRLEGLYTGDPQVLEWKRIIDLCVQANQAVEQGNAQQALQSLQRLKGLTPASAWLDQALDQAQQAVDGSERLRAGPLGLLDSNTREDPGAGAIRTTTDRPLGSFEKRTPMTPLGDNPVNGTVDYPGSFIVQIDGVGSFLIYTDPSLSIGPISADSRPRLGLMADPNLPTVTISRIEEDYFASSVDGARINQRQLNRSLLTDGDRICLSGKCRLKFNRPNAASTTATLTISGGRLARPDINYVILMDQNILIGPGAHHHIRAAQATDTVALLWHNNRLLQKSRDLAQVQGRTLGAQEGLPMNKSIRIGRLTLVIIPNKP
jgi:hypothetical protein